MINFPNVTATLEPSAEFLVCKRQVRIQRRMKGMIILLTAFLSVAGRLILPGIQNDLYKTANEIDCQVSEVFRFQPLNSPRHPLNRQLLDPPLANSGGATPGRARSWLEDPPPWLGPSPVYCLCSIR